MIINTLADLNCYDNKFVVYLLTSPSGKKYCGYSSNIKRRWRKNGYEYKTEKGIGGAIKKYKWENFKKEILFSFDTSEEALAKEEAYINEHDLLNPLKGYNLIEGGGNPPHGKDFISPEGLEAMRKNGKRLADEVWGDPEKADYVIQRMREETHKARMKMSEEERKEKYGKHNIGKKPSNTKIICQLDLETGEIINEFFGSNEAEKQLKLPKGANSNIRRVARGTRKSAYGYGWKWKEDIK